VKIHRAFLSAVLIAVIFIVTIPGASARESEFHGVVGAIETHYGIRHTHIPLLGFATFFVHYGGVSGVKIAVFEDFHASTVDDIRDVVKHNLGPDWQPFVRVHSATENTLIYVNPAKGKMRLMIVSIETTEATVVEVKLSDSAIERWIKDPEEEAGHHHRRSDGE
jgi:hypothetical protein